MLKLYSTRLDEELKGEFPDIYEYDEIPEKLRIQVTHILINVFGGKPYYDRMYGGSFNGYDFYSAVEKIFCEEYGLHNLPKHYEIGHPVLDFISNNTDPLRFLDIVELSFRLLDERKIKKNSNHIKTLNYRFKKSGLGYEYTDGKIIRIDSKFIHREVIKPALRLLGENPIFLAANEEFLKAHEHYRNNEFEASIVECHKAFESCMKAICDANKWHYDATSTASKLVNACLENGLIPPYMQDQMTNLGKILSGGLPTIRNRAGAHGQGTEVRDTPEHLVRLALNLAASNLVFLAECHDSING